MRYWETLKFILADIILEVGRSKTYMTAYSVTGSRGAYCQTFGVGERPFFESSTPYGCSQWQNAEHNLGWRSHCKIGKGRLQGKPNVCMCFCLETTRSHNLIHSNEAICRRYSLRLGTSDSKLRITWTTLLGPCYHKLFTTTATHYTARTIELIGAKNVKKLIITATSALAQKDWRP